MEKELLAAVIGGLIAIGGTLLSFWWRSAREARLINTAILAEISRLLSVIDEHEKWWSGCVQAGNTNYPLIPFSTDVYRQQARNIGLVKRDIVVQVVKFYGFVHYLNELQAVRAHYKAPANFDTQYQQALQLLLNDFRGAFDAAFARYGVGH